MEGTILVELGVAGDEVRDVRVSSSRRADSSRALLGLPVEAMLEAVPLLFSVCGEAQGVAAREACEAALGVEVGDAQRGPRRLRVACEAIDNQALQLALGWPGLFGGAPVVEPLRALRSATARLRAEARTPFVPSGVEGWAPRPAGSHPSTSLGVNGDELDRNFAHSSRDERFARSTEDAAQEVGARLAPLLGAPLPSEPGGLARWTEGPSVAQRAVAALLREGLEDLGRCEVQLLPALPAAWFEAQTRADPSFEWAPRFEGRPAETGALARLCDTPLISALLEAHGNGLLTRFVAHVADLEELGARVLSLARGERSEAVSPPALRASGQGAAVVDTSRGRLAHVVEVEQDRLVGWRVVAPTEWNFHPEGALAAGLRGAPARDAERAARLLVSALDPCVGFEVRVRRAVDA